MCGRYSLITTPEKLTSYFGIQDAGLYSGPRVNIAPSQYVPAIVMVGGERRLDLFRWGLLPSWAKDEKLDYSTINARAETVDSKPAFRSAFAHRRCLIPADGFYEWQAAEGHKHPWRIVPSERNGLFAFAGIWETWAGEEGNIQTCSIIVGEPNDLVRPIHDRMPVILEPESFDIWLDERTDKMILKALLRPLATSHMRAFRVSEHVNNPHNEDALCIRAIE